MFRECCDPFGPPKRSPGSLIIHYHWLCDICPLSFDIIIDFGKPSCAIAPKNWFKYNTLALYLCTDNQANQVTEGDASYKS